MAVVAALLAMPLPSAAQDHWQIGWMPSLSSGRYGSDTTTDVFYTPLTARRLFDRGDVTLVLPMLCVWGGSGLVIVNNTPVVPDQTAVRPRAAAAGQTPATRPGTTTTAPTRGTGEVTTASTPAVAPAPTPATATRACGLGDVVLRGRYYLTAGAADTTSVAVRAHVKTPTASASRGLGTGRPDEGIALEVGQPVRGGLTLLGDVGYTWIGKPVGADYRDTWWYDVGVSRDVARGVANIAVLYEEYGAVFPGMVNARDVLVAATIRGMGGWRIQAAGTLGLSDAAADHGLTIGLSRRF
jgi:hypothetical protein